jgi:beta-lactamase superfamily II metal-dependent hydrolase
MIHPDVLANKKGYAIFPSVKIKNFVYSKQKKAKVFKDIKQLLFGDYMSLVLKDGQPEYLTVKNQTYVKISSRAKGYVKVKDIQPNRILEVGFIDVGQGDGCHFVTPNDNHFIIDAGKADNMFRYFNWRFNLRKDYNRVPNCHAIISHSDEDHYGGFTKIFESRRKTGEPTFDIKEVFHNGMIEESGTKISTLGTVISKNGKEHISDLVISPNDFSNKLNNVKKEGRYISLLKKTTSPIKALDYKSPPIFDKDDLKIEVLGPVTELINNKKALEVIDKNKGRTKNGHSVILKLTYGKLRILLGGDLNSTTEYVIIKKYTGVDIPAEMELIENSVDVQEIASAKSRITQAIIDMRAIFEVDVAKSCHHGSADFTNDFLDILNPIATVVSSGDDEPHCHPRPVTLGTIGKFSRGARSFIYSTELARSSKEFIDLAANSNTAKKKERIVTVYGMISLRADKDKFIIAQKLERKSGSAEFDIVEFKWDTKLNDFVAKD